MKTELNVISMPGSHNSIIKVMDNLPRGKVLDSPCGSGVLSKRLAEKGFDVDCCDIDAGNFQLDETFKLRLADFNKDKLPYPDKEFDYIICVNGLHRLYYPVNLLEEFSRVLKDNGKLVVSWPNYNSLARRIKYLVFGSPGASIDFADYEQTITDPAAKLRFPLSASRVDYLLKNIDISIESVDSIGMQIYDYILYPISLILSVLDSITIKQMNNRLAVIKGGTTTIAVCKKI